MTPPLPSCCCDAQILEHYPQIRQNAQHCDLRFEF
ncbi:hypothetical protein CBM2629_B140041 [Cupriavidus taiwanensis]|nr:hypothetical protein CBM2629_B140041 [Cupriavidus taiwanensis]